MTVGIHIRRIPIENLGMDTVFDDLSRVLSQPRRNGRPAARAIALDLAGKLAGGLAIGLGIAIGMALAG